MNSASGEDVTRSMKFARYVTGDSDLDPVENTNYRIIKSEAYQLAATAESISELHQTSLGGLAKSLHFAASDLYRSARALENNRNPRRRQLESLKDDYKLVKKTYNRLYRAYSRGDERGADRLMRAVISSYRAIKREMGR